MLGLLLTARLTASPSLKKQRNQQDEKKPSATDDCREHADHRHPSRSDIPPLPSNAQTDEREHRQAERNHWNKEERFWRRQIWFYAVTTLAAVLAAIAAAWALNFSRQAVEQAQVQAEISRLALLNADRPWVMIEGLSSADLKVLDDYVFVTSDLRVRNGVLQQDTHSLRRGCWSRIWEETDRKRPSPFAGRLSGKATRLLIDFCSRTKKPILG